MKIFSRCIKKNTFWGYLLAFYLPTMLKIQSSSFMSTHRRTKGATAHVHAPVSDGKAECALMTARPCEGGVRKGEARRCLPQPASWPGSVLTTKLNDLSWVLWESTYFLPSENPSLLREPKPWSPRSFQVISRLEKFHAHWLRYEAET